MFGLRKLMLPFAPREPPCCAEAALTRSPSFLLQLQAASTHHDTHRSTTLPHRPICRGFAELMCGLRAFLSLASSLSRAPAP